MGYGELIGHSGHWGILWFMVFFFGYRCLSRCFAGEFGGASLVFKITEKRIPDNQHNKIRRMYLCFYDLKCFILWYRLNGLQIIIGRSMEKAGLLRS